MTINVYKDRVIHAGDVIRQDIWIGAQDLYTPSLYNYGTISVGGDAAKVMAIAMRSTCPAEGLTFNEAGGIIKVAGTGANTSAYGFYQDGDAAAVRNDGLIQVSSTYDAYGVYDWIGNLRTINSGSVEVTADHIALGVGGYSVGVDNSGSVTATGGLYGIGVSLEVEDLGFNNSGKIIASGGSADYASIGVLLTTAETHVQNYLTNTGLISSDYAIYVDQTAWSSNLQTREVLFNSGFIHGAIYLFDAADSIINTGTIDGDAFLGSGNDFYDAAEGGSAGAVLGEDGADLLIGGDLADVLVGGEGADVILAGGGDDVVVGGHGSDRLEGGAGYDTLSYATSTASAWVDLAAGVAEAAGRDVFSSFEAVVGSAFADTLTGSDGDNYLEARQGDDILAGGAGDDTIYAGAGSDVVTGGKGDDIFIFSTGDGADTVGDFQAGGNQDELFIFGYAGYQRLVQVGHDTLVVLSDTDQILLKKVSVADLTRADFHFDTTPLPAAPAAPVLQTPSLITSDWSSFAGEVYRAAAANPIQVQAPAFGQCPAIYNGGTLLLSSSSSPDDHPGLFGIYANLWPNSGGFILNEQTGRIDEHAYTGDLIGLSNRGVYSDHAPDVFNDGVWTLAADQGAAVGFDFGVGQLVNRGDIELFGHTSATLYDALDTSVVWNSGVIQVSSDGEAIGIQRGLVIVNTGTITASSSDPASEASGIKYGSYGAALRQIYNTGVIDAAEAINAVPQNEEWAGLGPARIINSGELLGQVGTGDGADVLLNGGLITGAVSLRGGGDTYDGRLGSESGGVFGGAGDDVLMGGRSGDSLVGEDGDDRLSGGGGGDTLTGGSGVNVFHFEAGDGADLVTDFGASASNVLEVAGYASYRRLVQQGTDTLVVLSNTDSIRLQNVQASALNAADFHFSAAAYDAPQPMPALPDAPDVPTAPDPLPGPAPLMGGMGSDELNGGSGGELILGLAGDDTLRGLSGPDTLFGGSGADKFVHDLGDGLDTIFDFNADEGDRLLIEGSTTITYYQRQADVEIDIGITETILVCNSTVDQIEAFVTAVPFNSIVGHSASELLTGTKAADDISGLRGLDTLKGMDGNDRLDGGDGNDRLLGGPGNDLLTGGDGIDFAVYNDAPSAVRVSLALTGAQDTGGAGVDTVAGVENLVGSRYDDVLTGDGGVNALSGGPGDDVLDGGAGSDVLDGGPGRDAASYANADGSVTVSLARSDAQDTGGAGTDTLTGIERLVGSAFADVLSGDSHANTLDGGGGADQLRGGGGADRFIFADWQGNGDVILDLASDDVIDLSAIDADTGVTGDQAFVLVHSFDHKAAEATLTYDQATGSTRLDLDVDGDGAKDLEVTLNGDQRTFNHFVL